MREPFFIADIALACRVGRWRRFVPDEVDNASDCAGRLAVPVFVAGGI